MDFKFITQTEDNKIIANERIDIILDKNFFDDEISSFTDDRVNTLGIFTFRVYKSSDKLDEYIDYLLNLPASIYINNYNNYTVGDNIFFSYDKDDIICNFMTLIPNVKSTDSFLNYLQTCKIPLNDFEDLVGLYNASVNLNNVGSPVQSFIIEAMVSELTRYKEDELELLRVALKNPKVTKKDFQVIRIKDVARTTSTFNAISFEDMNKSLTVGVDISRFKRKQRISPLENVIQY